MELSAMQRLFPDLEEQAWPTWEPAESEAVYLTTSRRRLTPAEGGDGQITRARATERCKS